MASGIPQSHYTDRPLMWRSAAGLLVAASVLTVVEVAAIAPSHVLGIVVGGLVSLVLGFFAWIFGPKLSPRTSFHVGRVFLFICILTVAHSMHSWRGSFVMLATSFHYITITLFAAAFFTRREVGQVLVAIGICLGVVLAHNGSIGENTFVWLIVMVDLASVSFVMSTVVDRIRRLSYNDSLTGALNRRGWDIALGREIDSHKRSGAPLSLVLVDIDDFKSVNDRIGHEGGDEFLKTVSTIFGAQKRTTDHLARMGGDEFALLLPGSDELGSVRFANALLATLILETGVSCSIGVATLRKGDDPTQLFASADRFVYIAKSNGRAQVRSASSSRPSSSEIEREIELLQSFDPNRSPTPVEALS
jgi:diguanylate cyclase (GGDEF)-like protein